MSCSRWRNWCADIVKKKGLCWILSVPSPRITRRLWVPRRLPPCTTSRDFHALKSDAKQKYCALQRDLPICFFAFLTAFTLQSRNLNIWNLLWHFCEAVAKEMPWMFPAESQGIPLWLPFTPRFICIHSINVFHCSFWKSLHQHLPNSFKHTQIQNTWQIQWEVSPACQIQSHPESTTRRRVRPPRMSESQV